MSADLIREATAAGLADAACERFVAGRIRHREMTARVAGAVQILPDCGKPLRDRSGSLIIRSHDSGGRPSTGPAK